MSTQKKLYLSILLASSSHSALALDPAAIDYDGIAVTPTLEVAGTYDDNYLTLNDEFAESSWITSITPTVAITAFGEKSLYEVSYTLNHQIFSDSGATNLTNHFLNANANFEFDVRNRLSIGANINKTETAANAFTIGELNAFTSKNIGANYVYGAPSATGNIELGVNRENYRSDNGENLDQERDSTSWNAGFIYKITDKTRLTTEVKQTNFDYVINDTLDSKNTSYLFGARWDATAKTTGYAKIGKTVKDFNESGKDNADLSTWEVSMDWAPRSYSVITLKTNQRIDEGNYGADYTDTVQHSADWRHDWGRGYVSNVGISLANRDYSNDREDDTNSYNVGLTYMAKRWLDINFNYRHTNQNSTDIDYDYERNVFKLSVDVSL